MWATLKFCRKSLASSPVDRILDGVVPIGRNDAVLVRRPSVDKLGRHCIQYSQVGRKNKQKWNTFHCPHGRGETSRVMMDRSRTVPVIPAVGLLLVAARTCRRSHLLHSKLIWWKHYSVDSNWSDGRALWWWQHTLRMSVNRRLYGVCVNCHTKLWRRTAWSRIKETETLYSLQRLQLATYWAGLASKKHKFISVN